MCSVDGDITPGSEAEHITNTEIVVNTPILANHLYTVLSNTVKYGGVMKW
jgi:hypothetical protein